MIDCLKQQVSGIGTRSHASNNQQDKDEYVLGRCRDPAVMD